MITATTLITKRLQLSTPKKEDLEQVVTLLNESPEFSNNTLNLPYPYTKANGEFWISLAENGLRNEDAVIFAIKDKKNLNLMGGIGLHITPAHHKAELGYWIGKPFWNKGYATEALESVLNYGLNQLNLNKIYASHFLHNPASGKIMEKCGMQIEATLIGEYYKNGNPLDIIRFAKFR